MKKYTREEQKKIIEDERDELNREFLRAATCCCFDEKYLGCFTTEADFLKKIFIFMAIEDQFPEIVLKEMDQCESLKKIQRCRRDYMRALFSAADGNAEEDVGKALEQIQREMDRWNEESYNVSLIYEENESLKHENRELKKQIEDIRRQQEAVTEEKPSFFRLLIALFDRSKIKKSQQENRDVRTEYLISLLTDVGLSPRAIDILEEAYESGFSVEELKHLYETSEEEMEDEYRKTCYRREKRIRFERAQRYRGEQSGGI